MEALTIGNNMWTIIRLLLSQSVQGNTQTYK